MVIRKDQSELKDIPAKLVYREGKLNNFISRGKPFHKIPLNLLFALYVTSVTEKLGLDKIAMETQKDEMLSKLSRFVKNGQTSIPKTG